MKAVLWTLTLTIAAVAVWSVAATWTAPRAAIPADDAPAPALELKAQPPPRGSPSEFERDDSLRLIFLRAGMQVQTNGG